MQNSPKNKVQPGVEALEERQLLASHIGFNPFMGVATVVGTVRNDTVVLRYRGPFVQVKISGGVNQAKNIPASILRGYTFVHVGGWDMIYNYTSTPLLNNPFGTTPSAAPAAAAPVDLSAGVQSLIAQTNAARAARGITPLTVNPLLLQMAQGHADNMARENKFGDTDTDGHILDGHDWTWRAAQVGYGYSYLGENVAYDFGYADPATQLFLQWWNSPAHQANMLDPHYTQIGVGLAHGPTGRTYGVMDFGTPP
jgi:uncharacterized protein YkwD